MADTSQWLQILHMWAESQGGRGFLVTNQRPATGERPGLEVVAFDDRDEFIFESSRFLPISPRLDPRREIQLVIEAIREVQSSGTDPSKTNQETDTNE